MTNTDKTYTVSDSGVVLVSGVSKTDAISTWARRRALYRPEFADAVTISVCVTFDPKGRELRHACEELDTRTGSLDSDEAAAAFASIATIEGLMDEHRAAKAKAQAERAAIDYAAATDPDADDPADLGPTAW